MATEDFLPPRAGMTEAAVAGMTFEGVPIVADDSVPAGKILPLAPKPCERCGKPFVPVSDATTCSTCFAQLVNAAGKPVDTGRTPLRLTASEVVEKDALEHRGTLLPVIAHDALIKASERLAESLANDPEGSAMLYAQAKDHGLLVMVVVQAAIPRDQQKPATAAPRRR